MYSEYKKRDEYIKLYEEEEDDESEYKLKEDILEYLKY